MELTIRDLLFAFLDMLAEAEAEDVMDFAPRLTEDRVYDIMEVKERWLDEHREVWIRHYENGQETN